MKKLLPRILSVAMVAAMAFTMAACAPAANSQATTDSQAASDTPAASSEAATDSPTDSASEAATDVASEAASDSASPAAAGGTFAASMVTDTGGVNDQSFNQSAWEGLQKFKTDSGSEISYLESKQEADYAPNLDKLSDGKNNLIWGIGFLMADAVDNSAKTNPDQKYAIIDYSYGDKTQPNVTGVVFRAQEPSFLEGYLAAKTTKTGKIGFVGGISGVVIDQFEYGYRAGAAYAAKEMGKTIDVTVQYADSFSDAAKGKAIATTMYTNGCDIVFHAAGGVGIGVIEAAKEMNKLVIGVDRDQSSLAPDNVMSSAMKLVGNAVENVSQQEKDGQSLGGQTVAFGMKEGAAGIPDYTGSTAKLVDKAAYDDTMKVKDQIVSGTIVPPYDKDTFTAYTATLQ